MNLEKIIETRAYIRDLWEKLKPKTTHTVEAPKEDWENICALCEEYGFRVQVFTNNELIIYKPGRLERWDYALKNIPPIDSQWNCLDVGSGRNPWPRANYIMDAYDEFDKYKLSNQKFVKCLITETTPFADKFFDFTSAFHVLEHVNDPIFACNEISRISKSGIIECPHPWKDGLLLFQEQDHRWMVFPPDKDGYLLFKAIDRKLLEKLSDPDAQGAAYRIYLSNRNNIGDSAILRNYFSRMEPYLNVIYYWQGQIKARIIE